MKKSEGTGNFRNSVQFVKFVKKQVLRTWRRRSHFWKVHSTCAAIWSPTSLISWVTVFV